MLRNFLHGLAELFLTAAAVALVVAMTLLLFASWLISKSPRERKIKALIHLATAGMAAVQTFNDKPSQDVTKNA